MTQEDKNAFSGVAALIVAFGLILGCIVFRYDLGLVKPKFSVGDCIRYDTGSEFKKDYIHYKVLQVGKKQYELMWYSDKNTAFKSGNDALSIESTDSVYEKTSCPEKIELL